MIVANFKMKRVLIDSGSSTDILFLTPYDQLRLGRERLRPVRSPLIGFSGEPVYPKGQVALPVTMGDEGTQLTQMVDFLVVDIPSAYNIILGRTALNKAKAVISTHHLKVKFPTPNGIGEMKGDQKSARECYNYSIKKAKETLTLQGIHDMDLDVRDEEKLI